MSFVFNCDSFVSHTILREHLRSRREERLVVPHTCLHRGDQHSVLLCTPNIMSTPLAHNADPVADEADKLYTAVAAASVDEDGRRSKVFHQDELLQFAGLDEARALMPLIQHLTSQGLFRTLRLSGKLGWSVRPRGAAAHITSLDREEKLIYEVIEESHTTGLWLKYIKSKTNLAPNTVSKAVQKMEKALLIKGIKSVKAPAQRVYMLYHLVPSEEVTGNSFFDAGDLDESFRDELMNLIVFWVRQQSWKEGKRVKREPTSPILIADDAETGGKKRKRTADIEDTGQRIKHRSSRHDPETEFPTQLIYPAGTHHYPTAEEIHEFLTSTGAIKPTKASSLTVPEIQSCIDVLCWDEKLEKVPNTDDIAWGYRTVRGVTYRQPGTFEEYIDHAGTGLTQAPCGRCPVSDLCHESGPVNPQECVYFTKWLET